MKDYKENFEKLKQFKEEQNKQKQRGLNNYNILTSVLNKSDEVRLHSRMIFSFLNPKGTHYQGSLFLDKFLEVLNVDNFDITSSNCSIHKEYENIDLYITDGNKHIILENKVYAGDKENQIKRYIEIIKNENENLDTQDILVIYLSLNKVKPSKYSLGELVIDENFIKQNNKNIALYKAIFYEREILKWLKKCQYEVQNITNLNEAFKQYIDVVKMINNKYKDKVMSLSDYIKNDKSIYKMAIDIQNELPKVRESIVNDFFSKIKKSLMNEGLTIDNGWIIDIGGSLSSSYASPLVIYKDTWGDGSKNNLIIKIEFQTICCNKAILGVKKQNKVYIKNDIVSKFSQKLSKINIKLKTNQHWLHYEHISQEIPDFSKYIMLTDDVEKIFLKRVLNLIKNFEIENELLTEINTYLKNKI